MNRTLKEATVKKYYSESHAQLKEHLQNFVNAYNFAKKLKTLKGLTPYEYIIKCWQNEPERFKLNPKHHTMRLYTYTKAAARRKIQNSQESLKALSVKYRVNHKTVST